MREMLDKLGLPGVIGFGLLLFCLAFLFGNSVPLQKELAILETEKAQLSASQRAATDSAQAVAGTVLPSFAQAPDLLLQLNAVAEKHGVVVERTAYLLKDETEPLRLEVSMPLKLGYPTLRAYLRDVMTLPAVSLDELTLQRSLASDPALEAQVRLSFGFTRTP